MSTSDANLAASGGQVADNPPASGVAHRTTMLGTLIVLIRRELWEHRVLWMAPAVIAVLLVACAFPARLDFPVFDGADSTFRGDSGRLALFGLMQWGLTVPLYLVMLIVLNFYLLDCLYAERKDRSILFWKSLPVSDAATVASKLLVALVVVPLGVYLLSIVANLLFSVIWIARASLGQLPAAVSIWDTVTFLKVEALMLLGLIVSALWYAPLAAFLVLVSAWARRSVFLWATLPPVFAIIVERFALGTHFVAGLLEYRTVGIWHSLYPRNTIERAIVTGGHDGIVSLSGLFDVIEIRQVFLNIDLWLGLAVAAGFAFAAARIRRYRDDT